MRKDMIDTAFTAAELRGTDVEPTYSGALSFLRRRYSKNLEEADFAIYGVPFDIATIRRSAVGNRTRRKRWVRLTRVR